MIKHSETILNKYIKRLDSTWTYKWNSEYPDKDGTFFINPDLNNEKQNIIDIKNSIENVYIDPIPPQFISDLNSEYVTLSPNFNENINDPTINYVQQTNNVLRHLEFQFIDESGLDFKQFEILLRKDNDAGDEDNIILYSYKRPNLDSSNNPYYYPGNEYSKNKRWIKNVEIKANGNGLYTLGFDLVDNFVDYPHENYNKIITGYDLNNNPIFKKFIYLNFLDTEKVNNYKTETNTIEEAYFDYLTDPNIRRHLRGRLQIKIYDIAGNITLYNIEKEFYQLQLFDLNDLEPVIIKFYDEEPNDYYIKNGIEGKVSVNVKNPNNFLWRFPIECELSNNSIGMIEKSTYIDKNYYPDEGIRKFNVNNIKEYGDVIVNAWIETGNKNIDNILKEKTFNTGIDGKWYFAAEGRIYNLNLFVPKLLDNTEFKDFINLTQNFLNTIYMSQDINKNISVLEKIARINNFNDVSKIENKSLFHLNNNLANEIPFDSNALKELNNILTPNSNLYSIKSDDEFYTQVKYMISQLSNFNLNKGTMQGTALALKALGFYCKLINLWINDSDKIVKNPNFIEEDRIHSFNNYFLTSRFNIEIDGSNNLFDILNDNIDYLILLINNIKPLTRILNLIKYTITSNKNIRIITNLSNYNNNPENLISYKLIWNITKSFAFKQSKTTIFDNTTNMCLNLSFPYTPSISYITKNNSTIDSFNSYYNIIGKLFESNFKNLYISCYKEYINENNEIKNESNTFLLPANTYNVALNGGYFSLHEIKCNILYKLYNDYLNYNKLSDSNELIYGYNYNVKLGINIIKAENSNFIKSIPYSNMNI